MRFWLFPCGCLGTQTDAVCPVDAVLRCVGEHYVRHNLNGWCQCGAKQCISRDGPLNYSDDEDDQEHADCTKAEAGQAHANGATTEDNHANGSDAGPSQQKPADDDHDKDDADDDENPDEEYDPSEEEKEESCHRSDEDNDR